MSDAVVSLPSRSIAALTREDGSFELRNVPVGVHVVRVRQLGYQELLRTVNLDSAVSGLDLRLEQDPMVLEGLQVVVEGELTVSGTDGRQLIIDSGGSMAWKRFGLGIALVAAAASFACGGENRAAPRASGRGALTKGGDDRTGPYQVVEGWWKPAPDHGEGWTWGSVSGVAVDTPDRIIVAIWGDQNAEGQERPGSTNYLVVVNRNGDMVENWSRWDSLFNRPHQVYISPYDPERHVWVVERGGNGVHEQILKFTNDGRELVMRLRDPQPVMSEEETRANTNPGPLDFGQPAVMAFLPDGHFLLGDGYQNGRVAKYTTDGEFVMQFGSVGTGPGQFDLVHGIAVDRNRRIFVCDRMNHRVQVFTEDGEFIEEWPGIYDPVGIFIDESEFVWVLDATLNRILKYSLEGELLDHWGAFAKVSSLGRSGWTGGMALPHQMDVDGEGNLYVAEFSGPWLDKFVPKLGADPARLIGKQLPGTN